MRSSLGVSYLSVTVQNSCIWGIKCTRAKFVSKKKKKCSCPEHRQSRHNQRQWSTMKPAPEYETVRQFNSAITNWLQYLIGSVLSTLVKNRPLVWKDYMVFSSYSKQETPLFLLFPAKLLNAFWLFKIGHQSLESQICWLCFDDQMKSPISIGLCSVARILNFPRTIHTGHAVNFGGWNLESFASHPTLCNANLFERGESNEKSGEREWWRKCRQQHGGRLCACRRTDIECSHMRCWWETTCFFWSTAACIVEVISFSCLSPSKPLSRQGENNLFNKHLKAVYPSFSLIGGPERLLQFG